MAPVAYLVAKVKKHINHFDDPVWGWGLRIAIAIVVPMAIGILTDTTKYMMWIAIAAESTAFIELKGDVTQRIRILAGSIFLNIVFVFVGALVHPIWPLAALVMFFVGFLSGLFKNLGEKGAALALSVYSSAILNIGIPVADFDALLDRSGLFLIGGVWTALVNIVGVYLMRESTPYRRTISEIWAAVADLASVGALGWDGKSKRPSLRVVYLKEKQLRNTINSSLAFFSTTIDQVKDQNSKTYKLAQSRKVAVLMGLHIIQIVELVDQIPKSQLNRKFSLSIFSLFRTISNLGQRMSHYISHIKEEERMLIATKLSRLNYLQQHLNDSTKDHPELETITNEISVLTKRMIKLLNKALELHETQDEQRSFKSYSFFETLLILHPKYLKDTVKNLLKKDSLTVRYALRVGLSAGIGYLLQYFVFNDHGYWIPMTAIIVSQPYVNATLKKGVERSIGTVLGIIIGSLVLVLPMSSAMILIMLFFSSIFIVYFLKTKYSIATFFITLMLIAILDIESSFDFHLLTMRVLNTVVGAGIAIIAGFVFFPTYDKKLLPKFMAEAIEANYIYFQNTFYAKGAANQNNWTQYKRKSEIKNSDAFDSVTRFIKETIIKRKKGYAYYYFLIVHSIRITRELNSYHTENEFEEDLIPIKDIAQYHKLIYEIDATFSDVLKLSIDKFKNKYIDQNLIDASPVDGLKARIPTHFQMMHLEKCLNELKAIKTIMNNEVIEKSNLILQPEIIAK